MVLQFGVHGLVDINNMKKTFIIIIALFSLTSCRWFTEGFGSPFIANAGFKIPPGSPAFQAGFKDGCNQIFYSRGNSFYRAMHRYHYDTKMSGNKEYRFGYKRGISFCFNTVISGSAGPVGAADKYLFPAGDPAGMTAMNYNNTVGGMFDGLGGPINPGLGSLDAQYDLLAGSGSSSAFGANPLWAGGSSGQFFGQ